MHEIFQRNIKSFCYSVYSVKINHQNHGKWYFCDLALLLVGLSIYVSIHLLKFLPRTFYTDIQKTKTTCEFCCFGVDEKVHRKMALFELTWRLQWLKYSLQLWWTEKHLRKPCGGWATTAEHHTSSTPIRLTKIGQMMFGKKKRFPDLCLISVIQTGVDLVPSFSFLTNLHKTPKMRSFTFHLSRSWPYTSNWKAKTFNHDSPWLDISFYLMGQECGLNEQHIHLVPEQLFLLYMGHDMNLPCVPHTA